MDRLAEALQGFDAEAEPQVQTTAQAIAAGNSSQDPNSQGLHRDGDRDGYGEGGGGGGGVIGRGARTWAGVEYVRIDGSHDSTQRRDAVVRFR